MKKKERVESLSLKMKKGRSSHLEASLLDGNRIDMNIGPITQKNKSK